MEKEGFKQLGFLVSEYLLLRKVTINIMMPPHNIDELHEPELDDLSEHLRRSEVVSEAWVLNLITLRGVLEKVHEKVQPPHVRRFTQFR